MSMYRQLWLAIIASIVTVGFLIHREFFSSAHRVAASATLIARRRELGPEA